MRVSWVPRPSFRTGGAASCSRKPSRGRATTSNGSAEKTSISRRPYATLPRSFASGAWDWPGTTAGWASSPLNWSVSTVRRIRSTSATTARRSSTSRHRTTSSQKPASSSRTSWRRALRPPNSTKRGPISASGPRRPSDASSAGQPRTAGPTFCGRCRISTDSTTTRGSRNGRWPSWTTARPKP